MINNYTESKKVPLYFGLLTCKMLTKVKNSFTERLSNT